LVLTIDILIGFICGRTCVVVRVIEVIGIKLSLGFLLIPRHPLPEEVVQLLKALEMLHRLLVLHEDPVVFHLSLIHDQLTALHKKLLCLLNLSNLVLLKAKGLHEVWKLNLLLGYSLALGKLNLELEGQLDGRKCYAIWGEAECKFH
jgi:hypothetical protein